MNKFKGTPGPWFYQIGDYDHHTIRNENSIVADVYAGYPFGDIRSNSSIISAAPELLEALQLLMAEQTGGNKSCGHNGFTCMCPYDKARAAIAKALGESK